MEGADLVRPRRDGGSLFAEAVAAGGHGGRLLDERPDADAEAALSDEGLRELRLAVLGISALQARRQARRKGVVFGQEPQKVPANRLGHVEHDRAGDLVVPNLVKAVFFSLHTPAVFPAGEDVDALGSIQSASDDQAHGSAVAHQPVDPPRRQDQGFRTEVSGQPVVALGVLKRRNVEEPDQIAVVAGVLELPLLVRQHASGAISPWKKWVSRPPDLRRESTPGGSSLMPTAGVSA